MVRPRPGTKGSAGQTITPCPRLPFQFIITMRWGRFFLFTILVSTIGLMMFYVGLRRGSMKMVAGNGLSMDEGNAIPRTHKASPGVVENSVYVPAMKMDAGKGLPMDVHVRNAMPRTPAVAEDAVPGLRRRLPQAILIGVAKCGTGESLSRSRGYGSLLVSHRRGVLKT